jgi:hypothetical protein
MKTIYKSKYLTFSKQDTYILDGKVCRERWYSIGIQSRDDDENKAHITLVGFGYYFSFIIPDWIIPPIKVEHSHFNPNTQQVSCFTTDEVREYALSLFEDCFTIRYGLQSGDSDTQKSKTWTVSWLVWRHVRQSFYNLDGTLFGHLENNLKGTGRFNEERWKLREQLVNDVPKVQFKFLDYDGAEGIATCYIVEREWRFGDKWCKWLSWFRKPWIRRELDISYNIEVGKRKDSWKGGTVGCSCDIMNNQLPEDAFKQHCKKDNLTYIGTI